MEKQYWTATDYPPYTLFAFSFTLISEPELIEYDYAGTPYAERVRLGDYLETGLQKLTQEEQREYTFIRDTVEAGGEDDYLRSIINADTSQQLNRYFRNKVPPILNGEIYNAVALIDRNDEWTTILANDKTNPHNIDDVIIKIPHQQDKDSVLKLMREYLFQEQAYKLLTLQCRTNQPLGFIRQRYAGDESYKYMLVTKFCPFLPGYYSILTLKEALYSHSKKPLLRKIEWRNICLSLITAVRELQKNDIYHNFIRQENIMLEISDERIVPVLTDFSKSSCGDRLQGSGRVVESASIFPYLPKEETDKTFPAAARELFMQPNPLPTSDLYSVAYVILMVSVYLELPDLENYMQEFRQQKPDERHDHHAVYDAVMKKFNLEIIDTVDLTIEDREPEGNWIMLNTSLSITYRIGQCIEDESSNTSLAEMNCTFCFV